MSPAQTESANSQRLDRKGSPVDEGELNFLAVHAGVGLTVRNPDCGVTVSGLLTRLPYELLDTLGGSQR